MKSPRALRSARIVSMLKRDLPRMQPSALKHERLASVANVLNHPVASLHSSDGTTRLIGFADRGRALPLVLIVDTDDTVRHAFVPHPGTDQDLLACLQADENVWAAERSTQPRQISGRLDYHGWDRLEKNIADSINRNKRV